MKRTFFLFVITCLPGLLFAQGQDRLEFLLDKLNDGGKSTYTMIFAHRGDWRNAPENSLQAFQNCIDQKIDGIEIDVQETKDGEIVIMHDKSVDRTTNGTGFIRDKTLKEIKSLKLRTPVKALSGHEVPTFEEVLIAMKGKILIQVDKWEPVLKKVLEIAEKQGCLNQLIFRSTKPSKAIKDLFGDYYHKVNFIPVINANGTMDDEKLDDYLKNLKFSTIGIAFNKDDLPIFNRIKELRKKGIRVWYNSLAGAKFNAGHDDEMAEYDLENSYGWLISKGANILMTDRPFFLLNYLKNNNKRQ